MAPNKTAAYNFTIVVPVYNEEDNMDMIEDKLRAYISHASHKSCVLFPDFVIAYPKNSRQRVLLFSDAYPSAWSVYRYPCSEVA